jgi:hypothetical protein
MLMLATIGIVVVPLPAIARCGEQSMAMKRADDDAWGAHAARFVHLRRA